jgi:hypothetical protein
MTSPPPSLRHATDAARASAARASVAPLSAILFAPPAADAAGHAMGVRASSALPVGAAVAPPSPVGTSTAPLSAVLFAPPAADAAGHAMGVGASSAPPVAVAAAPPPVGTTPLLVGGVPVHRLDVKNAFLHGTLTETVYCSQPVGFVDSSRPDLVCRLNKSLYGLKQAPQAWYSRFATLLTVGFVEAKSDTSLFIYHHAEGSGQASPLLGCDS